MNICADKVKQLRTKKGWTQEVLAKASGLSLRTVQRLERDGGGSGETAQALAAALEVEIGALFVDYPNPLSRWTKEKMMHGLIAITVIFAAVGFLMQLAGELKMFFDFYSLMFVVFYLAAITIVSFGVTGLIKSIEGLKYLFAANIEGGKAVEKLIAIYASQIKFLYGGAVIGVLLGSIAIHGNYNLVQSEEVFHKAYGVNLIVLFYCVILAEALIRPLMTKLKASLED